MQSSGRNNKPADLRARVSTSVTTVAKKATSPGTNTVRRKDTNVASARKNHLKEVCRSSKDKKSANSVTEDIDQDMDDFLAFTISSADVANISSEASCTVNVHINGAEVEALVDSGSSADMLGWMFYVVFASKEWMLAWRIVRPA